MATASPPKLDPVIRITDAAAERVRDIFGERRRAAVGLRVGVKNGGCAGMSYTMDLPNGEPARRSGRGQGRDVVVDPKAVLFLLGTEMDSLEDVETASCSITRTRSACGCGESVAITPSAERRSS